MKMMPLRGALLLALLSLCCCELALSQAGRNVSSTTTQNVPAPENDLGFKIGTDRKLAKWERFVSYFEHLDAASDRMMIENLGKTTLGRPFIVATISAPENLKRLDELKLIQRRLADPRLINQDPKIAEDLIQRGKTVVVITCSIHSTEVGGTFSATQLAHRLTSSNAPEIRQILENTIILLVPSLNPDGTDIVADWYQKTLGTPAEGTSPPELYHHYTGHDNNRDWYAFTQVETQLTVDKILNVWHPNILHDVHQQGASAARMFVPPYVEPWEPNIDPALIAGVSALGSAIAWELTAQGKSGVVINGIYDSWTPARAYAHYHGGLRILSETASARLATPIEIPFSQLSPGINYNSKVPSWNFPKPWLGGKWTIANIVDYQTSAAMALLNHAARYRDQYVRSFYEVNVRAIAPKPDVYAYLLPEPEFPKSLAADEEKLVNNNKNEANKTEKDHKDDDAAMKKITNSPATSEEVNYYYKIEGLDRVISILKRGGVEVLNAAKDFTADGKTYPKGTHIILMQQPYSSFAKTMLESQQYPDLREYPSGPPKRPYDVVAHTLPLLMNVQAVPIKAAFTVDGRREPSALVLQSRVRSNSSGARVGLYQNYLPSMDEGWTRWIFDQYKFPYTRLKQDEIRSGFLRSKFDAIILPDQSARAIAEGLYSGNGESPGAYPAEYTGGLGETGIKALKEFVEAGGTLITFNGASNFAIEHLGVPVRNVLQGVPARQFYCPGSILRTQLDTSSNLTFGMEKESVAWFEQSPAFEVLDEKSVRVIARYPNEVNPLLSGWILGDSLIRGKAALVEAKIGKGRVIMFGFRPQYRAQSLATFPLLFNSILTSKAE
jgi:hypothetical protein